MSRLLLLATLVACFACEDDVTSPAGELEVIISGPPSVIGVVSTSLVCIPHLVAEADGPSTAEAEWLGGRSGDWEFPYEQVLDAWGSSRIRGGERVESRYVGHMAGPPSGFEMDFIFRYENRATGEIRETESFSQRCVPPTG